MVSDSRPLGIFDSGLGGLTVMKEIVKLLPNENIVYFGDTGRVPYGTRSYETIRKYANQDEKFLLKNDVKLIIAACGTVSSISGEAEKALPVPFFEVISHTCRAAVKMSRNKRIGVIGTSATVGSGSHKKAIKEICPDALVFANSCSLFVPFVEEGWNSPEDPVVLETVRRYLAPLIEAKVDTLILGCTHYPILSEAIKKVMGEEVVLINAGEAVALAVKEYLQSSGATNCDNLSPNYEFYVSDKTATFEQTAKRLLGKELDGDKVKQVDIDKI